MGGHATNLLAALSGRAGASASGTLVRTAAFSESPKRRGDKAREETKMPTTTHTKAAEHHETAAKAHRTAAEHHTKGDHAAAHEHSTKAHGHSDAAHKQSTEAHSKSSQHAKK